MAVNEQIVTGRKFRKLLDEATKLWQRISFWTKATDVEFDDGQTAESKMGAIKGITTDLNVTETGYAADATMLTQLYSEITGLNLKDQELQNALAALDTRVTNAINGGDLAPPFEYNYLISNYITNKDGGIVTTADTASAWTFYDTGHPSTGTKYGMARTWPTQTAIKRNYKLVVNISAPVNGPVIELLNASGAAVVTISNLNSTTDLSQFAGQTLYPRFRGTYGYNNGARRTINFNTLKIFKQ